MRFGTDACGNFAGALAHRFLCCIRLLKQSSRFNEHAVLCGFCFRLSIAANNNFNPVLDLPLEAVMDVPSFLCICISWCVFKLRPRGKQSSPVRSPFRLCPRCCFDMPSIEYRCVVSPVVNIIPEKPITQKLSALRGEGPPESTISHKRVTARREMMFGVSQLKCVNHTHSAIMVRKKIH